MDHPSRVGTPPLRSEDLNEWNLRAEFGPNEDGRTETSEQRRSNHRPKSQRRKEIAMSITIITPQELAELCKEGRTMEILIPLGILVIWIILQAWVLPRFGVKT